MDVFSLLKFWRTTGDELNGEDAHSVTNPSVISPIDRSHTVNDDVDADESFIDFEFTVVDYDDKKEKYIAAKNSDSGTIDDDDGNQKAKKSRSTIPFFKSSSKFRVLMLFKKSKSNAISSDEHSSAAATVTATPNRYNQRRSEQSKGGFAIKCRVEEIPIISFISRVNSWRDKSQVRDGTKGYSSSNRSAYTKLLNPLYLKRFTDKSTFSSNGHEVDPLKSAVEKQGDRPAPALKIVCKHLGMSRLLSAPAVVKKDDYSLQIQQQDDGIQSAILHCKRSYSSKRREVDQMSPSKEREILDHGHGHGRKKEI